MSQVSRRDFVKWLSWAGGSAVACDILASHAAHGAGHPPTMAGEAGHFQQLPIDDLASAFPTPQSDARPWVYWFWIGGNVTRAGVTADLEAMRRVGIGGVLIMDVSLRAWGQGVPPAPCVNTAAPLPFMSVSWQEMFKFACSEAHRLGLKINMANDAGWMGSGGPWVTPAMAMQQVIWSKTLVQGGRRLDQVLPQPSSDRMVDSYYRDIAVVAFPTPPGGAAGGGARIANIQALADSPRGYDAGAQDDLRTSSGWPALPPDQVVPRRAIVDISQHMDRRGRLVWDVPRGRWTVLRFGHTTTGSHNTPAPPSGRGLESDKLSKKATDWQFHSQMGKLIKDIGTLAGETLVSTHIDSWESGVQNWTPTFREDFNRLRGYDPLPYLPVVTGRVVENLEVSQRFLWDFRQTISELLVENYAARMRDLAARHGLRLSIEGYFGVPANEMDYGGQAVEPMGELWSWQEAGAYGAANSVAEMTAAGRVWGHRIIGQETFTADDEEKWQGHPAVVKDIGDWAFCQGVNRFVIHRYAMQPWVNPHYAPGMSMGPYGLHYERTQTWWEMTRPWHEYIARCSYLLRQGLFVADVCYMMAEGAPQGATALPVPGAGDPWSRPRYKADSCPCEVVLTRMRVKKGRLVLPDGMSYRVLVLPQAQTMTPALLEKVKELADGGATVIGPRPERSPSLSHYPRCDAGVQGLAEKLWGCGKIATAKTAEDALAEKGVRPDFTSDNSVLIYCHRQTEDADIYFVANPAPAAVEARCTFRVDGKQPEFWDPETGRIEPAAVWEQTKDGTRVLIRLEWKGALFVVFRRGTAGRGGVVRASRNGQAVVSLRGPSNAAPAVVVKHAVYGAPRTGSPIRDVTSVVRRYAREGRRWFPVHDVYPATPGSADVLRVEYLWNGQSYTSEARNGELFYFAPSHVWKPPILDIGVSAKGKLRVTAFQAGRYRLDGASGGGVAIQVPLLPKPLEIPGPWVVNFAPGWGAPPEVVFAKLISWTDHPDSGVRYFSGTAVYHGSFVVPARFRGPERRVFLDLGNVEVIAQVALNGRNMGVLWKPPFRLDVTSWLRTGGNKLNIAVTNLWINRMIGDQYLPEGSDRNPNGTLKMWPQWLLEGKPIPTGRYSFTTNPLWHKDDPLVPSGLIGPVRLIVARTVLVGGDVDWVGPLPRACPGQVEGPRY